MHIDFKDKYTKLTDKEIVDKIVTPPYQEEGATFFIYNRYEPLCNSVTLRTFNNISHVDELQSELFILLKGKNGDWHALRSFQWRCSFGSWLKTTAFHLSLELKHKLIENNGKNISIDGADGGRDIEKHRHFDIPVDEEKARERRYRMVLLQETINKIPNPDQRFVVFKRLQGYSSKQIAVMLQNHWDAEGTIHYNNKHEVVHLDSGNIDNLFKRGYAKATEIFRTLERDDLRTLKPHKQSDRKTL